MNAADVQATNDTSAKLTMTLEMSALNAHVPANLMLPQLTAHYDDF